jgi:alpha-1,6-mannosyltransferase
MAQSSTVLTRLPALQSARAAVAGAGMLVMLGAGCSLVARAAGGPSIVVPAGRETYPAWMAGPLRDLATPANFEEAGVLLCLLAAGYLAALWGAAAVTPRVAITAIVTLHVVFLAGPPLYSADVFGYLGYARVGAVQGLSPYVDGVGAMRLDAIDPYVTWSNGVSPYGPLFTLLSYALVPLGIAGGFWAFKLLCTAASLGLIAIVWRLAEARGHDPVAAAIFVGLNPALLAFEVAGAHNDTLIALVLMLGVAAALSGRSAMAGGAVIAAAATKVSAGVLLPFVLLGAPRRGAAVAGAALATVLVAVVALLAFGGDGVNFLLTVQDQQRMVAEFSVPSQASGLLGLDGVTPAVRIVCLALLVGGVGLAVPDVAAAGVARAPTCGAASGT